MVREDGSAQLQLALKNAEEAFSYLLRKATEGVDLATARDKGLVMERLFSYIREMRSEVRRETYLQQLADRLDVPPEALRKDYERATSRERTPSPRTSESEDRGKSGLEGYRETPEMFLMLAAAANRPLFARVRRDLDVDHIEDTAARQLYVALEESYRRGENDSGSLLDRIEEPELRAWVSSRLVEDVFSVNSKETIEETLQTIKLGQLRRRQRSIDRALRRSEKSTADPRAVDELLHEKMHINDEISKIEELSKSKRVVNDGTAK
jgi:DNA primase